MVLQYYVVENETGKQIEIDIESATNEDLTSTKEKWQSDWTSEFIRDPKLEKYAAKTDAGEIVALGAYREDDHGISVFIANIEAHPFIAIGKITLLQGDPGDGKSTMMMNLIAELSTGGKTPDGCKIGAPQA